jgi:Uma2 family endonuclease
MATIRSNLSRQEPGPAWQIAQLFPDQGDLSESDYLFLTERTNRLAEFTDGQIEVLPMPTTAHQRIVRYLIGLLMAFAGDRGEVLFAPLRVRLRAGKFREPDVVFMLSEHSDRIGDRFWDGADLVMEIVSEDDPERDLEIKRREYAEAGIPEYWIVDPRKKAITVLKLQNQQYVSHSEGMNTGDVQSALLSGFSIDVAAVLAAAQSR